jgi:hypothetical protein
MLKPSSVSASTKGTFSNSAYTAERAFLLGPRHLSISRFVTSDVTRSSSLPINIVAGLMGMNVGGVPLAQHAHGF